MVASSAAPLKQCPPFPTSPQVQDPTLAMAMIQTGAPPYEELLRLFQEEELYAGGGEVVLVSHRW